MRAIRKAGAEACHTTLFCLLSVSRYCGNPVTLSQVGERSAAKSERQAPAKDQNGLAVARERCKLGLEIMLTRPRNDRELKPKRVGRSLSLADFNVMRRLVGRIG